MNARCLGALALALATTAACSVPDGTEDAPIPGEVSFSAGDLDSRNLAAELSFRHLYEHEAHILDGVDEIWAARVKVDAMGMAHTRITQSVNGVPVLGGEAIVHLTHNGQFAGVTDNLVRHLLVDTQPVYDQESSIELALEAFGEAEALTEAPEAELLVFRHNDIDHLAWRIQLRRLDGSASSAMPVYFIDAHTGVVILNYNNLHFKTLTDTDKRTLDMGNGTNYRAATPAATSDAVAAQAHRHAGYTLAYFRGQHGRNSYDNKGATVHSYVHYGSNYVNAFWDGRRLTYGDGDGRISGPLTVLDVVAHEFTHAVTSHEANLTYYGEPGALNEATSDIMAAAVEAAVRGNIDANTWKIGEDCWHAGGGALRFMHNPTRDGVSRDHYATRYNGKEDNAGVHINSGIGNLFFYLLSAGGQHPRPEHRRARVNAIGIDAAADIWYRALTTYMTSSTDFAGARAATIRAASDIFGQHSNERCQVQNAWAEVGVGSSCGSELPPRGATLQNARPLTKLSGNANTMSIFTMEVPQGTRALQVRIKGGTGEVDLYVRYGSSPTLQSFDCRPYLWGNDEICSFESPPAGTWYIGIHGDEKYSGVTLEGRYGTRR